MIKSFINKVIAILVGHFTVFKHSFKKPVTVKFPEQKINIPERFRGLHSAGVIYAKKFVLQELLKLQMTMEKNRLQLI